MRGTAGSPNTGGYSADERSPAERSSASHGGRKSAEDYDSGGGASISSINSCRSMGSNSEGPLPRRGPSTFMDDSSLGGRMRFSSKASVRENKEFNIADRYNIDAKAFASGGQGKVFVGTDKQLGGRKVAIKKVTCPDPERIRQIKQEMEIMKELDHPNICKLFETYEAGRDMYFVMELCEGGELFDRIADDGNVTEATAANIINQVAGALNYAHGINIAHRDLKPENICLVSSDPGQNAVKVIDWGLGFCFGGTSRMKSSVGSLAYAAPEVLEAEESSPYTSACDIWSLGAMSYVMLCGRPPFWGSVANQLKKMHAESYPMVFAPWDTISADAKDFIKCLLKNDPRDRMPISECLNHPWLKNSRDRDTVDTKAMSQVLWNMEKSSNNSKFLSVCLASAARQLDVNKFYDIKEVFQKLDANHDGTLDMEEMRNGMMDIFGESSEQAENVIRTFQQLDLDENGKIDYTEFCAAALSEKMLEQEDILYTAFKSFDVHGDDGRITKEEITEVLSKANVQAAWTPQVCDAVAKEVLDLFDKDGRGYLDFEAWVRMMRTVAWPEDDTPAVYMDGMTRTPSKGDVSTGRTPSKGDASARTVAWVSLDPRSGDIQAYPVDIAQIIELHFQMKADSIDLGAAFRNARVCFAGSTTGQPFQRTPTGLRDVLRVEIEPGCTDVNLQVTGTPGEFRFVLKVSPKPSQLKVASGLSKDAISEKDVLEIQKEAHEKRSRGSAAWSLSDSFGETAAAVGKLLWGSRHQEPTKTTI